MNIIKGIKPALMTSPSSNVHDTVEKSLKELFDQRSTTLNYTNDRHLEHQTCNEENRRLHSTQIHLSACKL